MTPSPRSRQISLRASSAMTSTCKTSTLWEIVGEKLTHPMKGDSLRLTQVLPLNSAMTARGLIGFRSRGLAWEKQASKTPTIAMITTLKKKKTPTLKSKTLTTSTARGSSTGPLEFLLEPIKDLMILKATIKGLKRRGRTALEGKHTKENQLLRILSSKEKAAPKEASLRCQELLLRTILTILPRTEAARYHSKVAKSKTP